jgi:hypothetical protein
MNYSVKFRQEIEEIGSVDNYVWGDEYKPKTGFRLAHDEEDNFFLEIWTDEKEPLARFTEDGEPVYKDSCLEFFVNFFPEMEESGYLNFEMNALGTILVGYGPGRGNRKSMLSLLKTRPVASISEDCWKVSLQIPNEFIREVFGKSTFGDGHMFKGNVYKCGDETKIPHYGSWAPIRAVEPDFHRPECFGDMRYSK